MKDLITLFLLTVLGISCSEDEISNSQYDVSTTIKITVIDQHGADLIDPNNQSYLKSEDIKIFHMIDGELTEYSEGLLTYSKGFRVYNPNDLGDNEQYVFCLLATCADGSDELMPITYVKWNETDMDTIQCQYYQTDNLLECTKVWFNNIVVWDMNDSEASSNRWFQIVKTL